MATIQGRRRTGACWEVAPIIGTELYARSTLHPWTFLELIKQYQIIYKEACVWKRRGFRNWPHVLEALWERSCYWPGSESWGLRFVARPFNIPKVPVYWEYPGVISELNSVEGAQGLGYSATHNNITSRHHQEIYFQQLERGFHYTSHLTPSSHGPARWCN